MSEINYDKEDVMICVKILSHYVREQERMRREIEYIMRKLRLYEREPTIYGVPISALKELGIIKTAGEKAEAEEEVELSEEEVRKIREKLKRVVEKTGSSK